VCDPLAEAALIGGQPAGHRLGRTGERGAFTESQRESRGEEHCHPGGEPGEHCGQSPQDSHQEQEFARAEPVGEDTAEYLEERVGNRERREHEAELRVGQPEILPDVGSGRGDVHPVHIGDEVHPAQQEHHPASDAATVGPQ
jgi:hypothetical protein